MFQGNGCLKSKPYFFMVLNVLGNTKIIFNCNQKATTEMYLLLWESNDIEKKCSLVTINRDILVLGYLRVRTYFIQSSAAPIPQH